MNDKRKRASIKIQSFFRAFVSRKSIWNLFEERRRQVQYEAATKCQSLIRLVFQGLVVIVVISLIPAYMCFVLPQSVFGALPRSPRRLV